MSSKTTEEVEDVVPPTSTTTTTTGDEPEDEDDRKSEVFEKDDANKSLDDTEVPEEDEEEEPIIGSLDKPIEILTVKRDRKSREFLDITPVNKRATEAEPDYTAGTGTEIRKMPYAKYQLEGEPDEDLVPLHQLMYRKPAKWLNWTRSRILKFKGWPFAKDSKFYKSHQVLCRRLTRPGVRYINELLGLDHSKERTTEEMTEDLFEFLMCPKDTGLEVPHPPPPKKKTPVVRRKRSARGRPRGSLPKGYAMADESSSDESVECQESSDDEADGRRKSRRRKSVKDDEDSESEDEVVAVPQKRGAPTNRGNPKKTPAKKTPAKKTPAKKTPAKKVARSSSSKKVPTPTRSSSRRGTSNRGVHAEETSESEEVSEEEVEVATKKRGRPNSNKKMVAAAKPATASRKRGRPKKEESEDDNDSDDEPLENASAKKRGRPAKKGTPQQLKKGTPKKPPTNAELKRSISEFLKDAALSAITMKKILNQIYDKYSDHDLSSQHEFLKKAVKDCL